VKCGGRAGAAASPGGGGAVDVRVLDFWRQRQ
jgi:hypothetical protein